jgi:hypothetical protein
MFLQNIDNYLHHHYQHKVCIINKYFLIYLRYNKYLKINNSEPGIGPPRGRQVGPFASGPRYAEALD